MNLLKLALAVYRLTHMVVYEDGPFNALETIRNLTYDLPEGHWIREGMHCPLCVSFWLSGAVYLLPSWLVDWLAIASVVMVIFKKVD